MYFFFNSMDYFHMYQIKIDVINNSLEFIKNIKHYVLFKQNFIFVTLLTEKLITSRSPTKDQNPIGFPVF